MANSNGWGDGSVNNNIGWGQGANNSTGWGKSHLNSWSGATDIDGGNPPVNSVAPALSGTAQEGQTLTCSTGTWSGSPTYTYQWKRDGNNITSATNSTYTLVTADVGTSIKCTVTATNFVGSATADSNTVVPVSAFTGLLDTYSGAAVAYSLRKLRSAYTGNAIRVRRSSDNAEQDFGFVNNVLDTASLLTFCGAGNGFVTTWYDQSGNARNITQTTAANQPQIVSSGAVLTQNTKPTLAFDGTSDVLRLVSSGTSTENTLITLSKATSTTPSYQCIATIGVIAAANPLSYLLINAGAIATKRTIYSDTGATSVDGNSTTNFELNQIFNTTNSVSMFINNNSETITNNTRTLTSNLNNIQVGSETTYNSRFGGNISEIIHYASNQVANQVGIASNINTFYSVY